MPVDATVGITPPPWAAAPPGRGHGAVAGTINIVALLPVAVVDAALVNTVGTVTEAKAQALRDAGGEGTGTPSDAVRTCPATGPPPPYGGPRWGWGSPLARAVHRVGPRRVRGTVITLVVGGARSGKSADAERLMARHAPPVTYVATMALAVSPSSRRASPTTAGGAPGHGRPWRPASTCPTSSPGATGTVLVDSLGPWVAAAPDRGGRRRRLVCRPASGGAGDTVVVSEEVGPGGAPVHRVGSGLPGSVGLAQPGGGGRGRRVLLVVAGRGLGASRRPRTPRARALSFLTLLGRAAEPNTDPFVALPLVGLVVGPGRGGVVGGRPPVAGRPGRGRWRWWPTRR